jgi:NAD-dependent deacetylase
MTDGAVEAQGREFAALLGKARRIFVFTGAGVSTASKIRDYRGPNGAYRTRDPVYYHEFVADERRRRDYWEEKLESWPAFRDAEPNATHAAIVELERAGRLGCCVTQNVDGLHRKAGTSAAKLIELHGTGREVECIKCGLRETPDRVMEAFAATREPPRCEECDALLKPAVVMFGQPLDVEALRHAERASAAADLVLALGTSLVVTPAADLPLVGVSRGAPYVIVNRGETPHDDLATLRIDADVTDVFPPAVASLGR